METSGTTPRVGVNAPDLAALARMEGPFATVHLTTESAVDNAAHRNELRWRGLRDALAQAGAPEEVLEAVDAVVPDAHAGGEGLAVVATAADGVVHVEHGVAPPPRDLARWAPVPSLVPLLDWRQSLPPYVSVLADRRGADLVAVAADGADIHREAGGGEDPLAKAKPGGWSQRRYQQRAENTWEHNADDVAKEVARLAEQVRARLVVAAGDVRALQLLREALPKEVLDLFEEVDGSRAPDGSADTFAAAVLERVRATVATDTNTLLAKFAEEAGQEDRAAVGPAPTFQALAMAQVEVLLVRDDLEDERVAWFGPDPAQAAVDPAYLRGLGVAEPAQDRMVDVAVRAALGTGAAVRVLPRDVEAGVVGGLAAILRWRT